MMDIMNDVNFIYDTLIESVNLGVIKQDREFKVYCFNSELISHVTFNLYLDIDVDNDAFGFCVDIETFNYFDEPMVRIDNCPYDKLTLKTNIFKMVTLIHNA